MSKPEPINYHAIPMEEMAKVEWKFWQAKRKGLDYPINPKFVPWGYYRYKRKDHTTIPLAIWGHEGKKYYRFGLAKTEWMGTAEQEAAWAYSVFQWVEKSPISKAEYNHWMETQEWLDPQGVEAVVAASKTERAKPAKPAKPAKVELPASTAPAAQPDPDLSPAAGIGHNSGDSEPLLTPEDALARVNVVLESGKTFQSISTQEQADASLAISNRLTELASEADKRREVLKKPHWDAGKAVDEAWTPAVIRPAREEAARLGRLRGAFAAAEKRRREDAAKAEQARLDAEAAKRRAEAPAEVEAEPETRTVVEAAPVVFNPAGGGKKKTARTTRGAKITDYEALVEAVKGYQNVRTFLQEVADKVYYAGGELPGCEEDLRVRG